MAGEPLYALIVPTGAAASVVAPGSAVVGRVIEGGYDCRYEGAVHFPMAWEDRVIHAAGRLHENYPTSAIAYLSVDDCVVVGTVGRDPHTGDWVVLDVTEADALKAWRGGDDTSPGASDEQRRRAAGKLLSRGGTRAMTAYVTAKARGADPVSAILATGR